MVSSATIFAIVASSASVQFIVMRYFSSNIASSDPESGLSGEMDLGGGKSPTPFPPPFQFFLAGEQMLFPRVVRLSGFVLAAMELGGGHCVDGEHQ